MSIASRVHRLRMRMIVSECLLIIIFCTHMEHDVGGVLVLGTVPGLEKATKL